MQRQLIECVPNFSEGVNLQIINDIATAIKNVDGVFLLDVDPGKSTNRTVMTFVGEPSKVVDAAFYAIKKAAELIDMRNHKGEHPRMGATDVCPFIPVSNISMEETAKWSVKLAERVGQELGIAVFLYEQAQPNKERSNLSVIRAGEYEGMAKKIALPNWKPDFGPTVLNEKAGCTVIGAREFLIAYNVNLNTRSTRIANRIAFDIREAGRVKRIGNPITGDIALDSAGEPIRIAGKLKQVKAIGWFIPEYNRAQISMNLTNFNVTALHTAFDETCKSAIERGVRVTGSELVGLIPLQAMLDAGTYFLNKQGMSAGVSHAALIDCAIQSMGLNELSEFDPEKKIIEYQLKKADSAVLINMPLIALVNETASDSPAPGGGSISATAAALGVALGIMVANLSAVKRGWETQVTFFSDWAVIGQKIKDDLLFLVDEDTRAFNAVMDCFSLPKNTDDEKKIRANRMEIANKNAMLIPFKTMQTAHKALALLTIMVEKGNPNSLSDVGVGALAVETGIHGAYLNVLINKAGIKDSVWSADIVGKAESILNNTQLICKEIVASVKLKITS